MQRSRVEIVLVGLLVLLASSGICAAQQSAISGVVRDSSGTAQLGVLVQVLTADSQIVGRAFTDLRGRYLVNDLKPGRYEVLATAALLAPASRAGLQLHSGVRAVVNLTMTTLADTAVWLPAERRKADEPADDWAWTLRSATNRPILRMTGDGEVVMVSSSAGESRKPTISGRAAMTSGDGDFGAGTIHNVLTVDRVEADGVGTVMRLDTGSGRMQQGIGPSTEVSAGFERKTGFASTTRAIASFQGHPEMLSSGNTHGLQAMNMATAQQTDLGDTIHLEAGSTVYMVHTAAYGITAEPFLRIMVNPASGWSVGYRLASGRSVQGFSDLNTVRPELPVAVMSAGKLRTERGFHQEIEVGHKVGRGLVQVSLYKDNLKTVALAGTGALNGDDLNSLGVNAAGFANGGIADSMTGSFRLLTSGYHASGVNVMLTQPIGQGIWTAVEYSTGEGLAGPNADPNAALSTVVNTLSARRAQSAAIAIKGTVPESGMRIRAVYRWQPNGLLTPVDAYREFTDQAFLSFRVLQPIRWDGVLPPGLEASIDITNLLAQGYRPFISADGRTFYLAQAPRTLQAGLSLTF